MLQAALAEVFKVEPLRDSPGPRVTDCRFFEASDITKLEAVKVATLTLPKALIFNTEVPLEEAALKISLVPAEP